MDSVPASRDTPGTLPAIIRKDSGGAPTGAPGEEKLDDHDPAVAVTAEPDGAVLNETESGLPVVTADRSSAVSVGLKNHAVPEDKNLSSENGSHTAFRKRLERNLSPSEILVFDSQLLYLPVQEFSGLRFLPEEFLKSLDLGPESFVFPLKFRDPLFERGKHPARSPP